MKNITFFFLFILIVGCESGINKSQPVLEFENEVSFPANDMSSTNPGMIQLIDTDSGEYIFLYNHVIKKLQFSEFPSGKLILNIPLEFDGEKRVRRFTGATLISRDTIGVTFFSSCHWNNKFRRGTEKV